MSKYKEVTDIARASLMPDFFAVRIDEEGIFALMQEFVAKVQLAQPMVQLDKLKELSAGAANCAAFIEDVKQGNLWATLRELLTKIKLD